MASSPRPSISKPQLARNLFPSLQANGRTCDSIKPRRTGPSLPSYTLATATASCRSPSWFARIPTASPRRSARMKNAAAYSERDVSFDHIRKSQAYISPTHLFFVFQEAHTHFSLPQSSIVGHRNYSPVTSGWMLAPDSKQPLAKVIGGPVSSSGQDSAGYNR